MDNQQDIERAYQDAMLDMELEELEQDLSDYDDPRDDARQDAIAQGNKIGEAIGDPCKTCVQAGTCIPTFGLCALLSPNDAALMDEIDAQTEEEHQVEAWHEHCYYRDTCRDAPEQCKRYCINRRTPPRFYERPNDETMDRLLASTRNHSLHSEPLRYTHETSRRNYRELAKMIVAMVAGAIVAYVLLGR